MMEPEPSESGSLSDWSLLSDLDEAGRTRRVSSRESSKLPKGLNQFRQKDSPDTPDSQIHSLVQVGTSCEPIDRLRAYVEASMDSTETRFSPTGSESSPLSPSGSASCLKNLHRKFEPENLAFPSASPSRSISEDIPVFPEEISSENQTDRDEACENKDTDPKNSGPDSSSDESQEFLRRNSDGDGSAEEGKKSEKQPEAIFPSRSQPDFQVPRKENFQSSSGTLEHLGLFQVLPQWKIDKILENAEKEYGSQSRGRSDLPKDNHKKSSFQNQKASRENSKSGAACPDPRPKQKLEGVNGIDFACILVIVLFALGILVLLGNLYILAFTYRTPMETILTTSQAKETAILSPANYVKELEDFCKSEGQKQSTCMYIKISEILQAMNKALDNLGDKPLDFSAEEKKILQKIEMQRAGNVSSVQRLKNYVKSPLKANFSDFIPPNLPQQIKSSFGQNWKKVQESEFVTQLWNTSNTGPLSASRLIRKALIAWTFI